MTSRGLRTALVAGLWASGVTAAPILDAPVAAAERLFAQPLPRSLDGRLAFIYRLARHEGHPSSGTHWLLGRDVTVDGLRVDIQLRREVSADDQRWLAAVGCSVDETPDGVKAVIGPVAQARCRWDALRQLAADARVKWVSAGFGRVPLPPNALPAPALADETEVAALARTVPEPGADGRGVTVGDCDNGLNVFHPLLFRLDGGYFSWVDVDHDGRFTPAIDAVDFNRDGAADPGEVLRVLKATVSWRGQTSYNDTLDFVAGLDWLFQDENGNGARDYGPLPPYGDEKPGFGEALFAVDDVNRNEALDLGEKLVLLKTPKLKRLLTYEETPTVFERGYDLASGPTGNGMHGNHATMVLTTLAGGQRGLTRVAGVAPGVDLVAVMGATDSQLVGAAAWAKARGAQLMIWELATWYAEFLDGSSALEQACDAASAQGVLQLAAAGNLAASQKHRFAVHPTGTSTVTLNVPDRFARYAIGNFNFPDAASVELTLAFEGASLALTGSGGSGALGTTTVDWQRSTSPRGTSMLLFYLRAPAGAYLTGGAATFEVKNPGAPVPMHGYVADDASGWNKGVYWPMGSAVIDLNTYGTPAVADHTLAVGAYATDFAVPGQAYGDLASYSSQGPRADGADSVDLVAPFDHLAADPRATAPFAQLAVGGGTSNAVPVVAGVAAHLAALDPAATPEQLAARLSAGTAVEAQMGVVPNDKWGAGKLRAYRAAYQRPPEAGGAPHAEGTAHRRAGTLTLDAAASSDPEGDALTFRWDLDYDGTWDVGPTAEPHVTDARAAGEWVKLEVKDGSGRSASTLVKVELTEAPLPADAGAADAGSPEPRPTASPCGCAAGGASVGGLLVLGRWARRRRAALLR